MRERLSARALPILLVFGALILSNAAFTGSNVASAAVPQWSVMTAPSPVTNGLSELQSVSCVSASLCVAVGDYTDTSTFQSFATAEIWNGTSWSIMPGTNIGSTSNRLTSVSCVTTTMCMAVGYTDGSGGSTLAQEWNGVQWSVLTSPNSGATNNNLTSVSCTSTTSCFAVGSDTQATDAVIDVWNGTTWTIAKSGVPGDFAAVSCSGPTSCMAVGAVYVGDELTVPMAQHWDGSTWSSTTPPSFSPHSAFFHGVSCSSATDCDAVGEVAISPYVTQTIAEHWDGTAWTVVASPNPGVAVQGMSASSLGDVSCVSPTDCVAAGYYSDSTAKSYVELIENYDGSAWTVASAPAVADMLDGVNCVATARCVAVGQGPHGNLISSIGIPPTTIPGAPTHVIVAPGNGIAALRWMAPANDGHSPITSFVVTPLLGGKAQTRQTFSAGARSASISGLKNGKAYTFRIAATNALGTGPSSAPTAAIIIGAPGAPVIRSAKPGKASATLTWAAPAADGAPVVAYVITPYKGTVRGTAVTFKTTATTARITGLAHGKSYTFTVAAKNSRGTGAPSAKSKAVKPT